MDPTQLNMASAG